MTPLLRTHPGYVFLQRLERLTRLTRLQRVYAGELNPRGVRLLQRAVVATIGDCMDAGLEREALLIVEARTL